MAFAEIEQFLDTPVKRFSTGMHTRLAFAVAAHLDSEILVVDEVLAVGDRQFQEKSLGKMGEVAGQGRSVLFVSHNMGAVTRFCTRGLLIDEGRVVMDANAEAAAAEYMRRGAAAGREDLSQRRSPGGAAWVDWAEVRDGDGVVGSNFSVGNSDRDCLRPTPRSAPASHQAGSLDHGQRWDAYCSRRR